MSKKGTFSLKKKTSFEEIDSSTKLPESDLCFQDEKFIYQFEFKKSEDNDKTIEINPGIFMIASAPGGVDLKKIEFRQRNLLETVSNTQKILSEANKFFNRLHIYDRLQRPKKRGVLLYSSPGMGKTSAIEKVCLNLITEDPGTVILVWPTSDIEADDMVKLLTVQAEYTPSCTRMVLVMEDIGGSEREIHHSSSGVESGLLNLLDGVGVVFKLPTFIMATTNHPESLLASLADRPGRFDLMLKLNPPSHAEKIELMRFISKRELSAEEQECLALNGTENFSVAHLEEIVIRSELDDKTYAQVVREIVDHQKLFKSSFEGPRRSMVIGFDDE